MGENYFGITDNGRQRINNEDRFIAKTVFNNDFIIACVIDGVGGYQGGEVAAQLTADAIISGLEKPKENIIDDMVSALQNANEKIIREKEVSPQNEKMACVVTLAVVDIKKNIFYFSHVGDTRLYLFRDGSLIKVTRDHSTVGFLEETGRLTEEAAMAHPKRNEINKALGFETHVPLAKDFIDTGESPFLPGDIILLCSDGLTDMIPSGKIISILNGSDDLAEKGQLLINAANEAGGKDNITVVIVHNDKSPVQHEATKPLITAKRNNDNGNEQTKIIGKTVPEKKQAIKNNPGKKIINWLLFFCIVFFLGFVWSLFKTYNQSGVVTKAIPVTAPVKQRSNRERIFLDSLNVSLNRTVHLIDSQPFIISDTILIKNDSLHIIGNGISFVRDSSYNGPAFVLAPNCKYILFDSLDIENFNVGILVMSKGLHLKKVQFKNCMVPLQLMQQLPQNTTISGTPAETIFNYKDSVKK